MLTRGHYTSIMILKLKSAQSVTLLVLILIIITTIKGQIIIIFCLHVKNRRRTAPEKCSAIASLAAAARPRQAARCLVRSVCEMFSEERNRKNGDFNAWAVRNWRSSSCKGTWPSLPRCAPHRTAQLKTNSHVTVQCTVRQET